MAEAFVLVQTEVGRAQLVADLIAAINGVLAAEYVVGPYDVVVRIGGDTVDEAGLGAVVREIQHLSHVTRTLTCHLAGVRT